MILTSTKVPFLLKTIARLNRATVKRDVCNCGRNIGATARRKIYLGDFDDPDIEAAAFFHELGHIISPKVIGNRETYLSKISQEALAWELGLGLASKHKYEWPDYHKVCNWAKAQLLTYIQNEEYMGEFHPEKEEKYENSSSKD